MKCCVETCGGKQCVNPSPSKIFINYWTRLRKISLFVDGEQINYLPMAKAEANN